MFGASPFYLGHLGRVPVYVLPEAIFTLLYVGMIANGVTGFIIMTVVVLTTILIHEFGHAAVARISGMGGVTILVGALGGMCLYQGQPDPRRRIAISLAGPFANLLIAGLLFTLARSTPDWRHWDPLLQEFFLLLFDWNLVLGIFNLLPIYPLDGGQATLGAIRAVTGQEAVARRATLITSFIAAPVALGAATLFLFGGNPPIFTMLILGLLLWQAWRDLR